MADETGIVVVEPGKDGSQPLEVLPEEPEALMEFIEATARHLGGIWNFAKGRLTPMSETLAYHAHDLGIVVMVPESLDRMALLYYVVAPILSLLYGLVIASLQNWEGWLYWFGALAIAAAFLGLSRAVKAAWEGYGLAKFRERPADIQGRKRTALALTAAFAAVDYAANVFLLTRAAQIASLGAPPHPILIALAAAVTTLGAVSLPVVVGLNRGALDEVHATWWTELRDMRSHELDQLSTAWAKLKVAQARIAAADAYPVGHRFRNGRK